ncbi:hypothetical protein GIB67_001357 [Kingdonia uniflora]|uniref:non-specific serine/threonine protein kinase n=1 Tax=Kingdonia uniflora TaxID=39325 RepID=A0A7J7MTR8_9MAGN|nr:hypothetical protein GIB67_001357 [Kingdonia uniflora]
MGFCNIIMVEELLSLLVFTVTLAFLTHTALAIGSQYEACKPQDCGNGLRMSYPFWIPQQQESYCGHPDFNVTCSKNNKPILRMSNDDYIIRNIFYKNQSLLVTNTGELSDICPTHLHNLTLVDTLFKFSPNHANLFFFYNCTLTPTDYFTYQIPCASNISSNSGYSFAAFVHEGGLQYLNISSKQCESFVGAPVEVDDGLTYEDMIKMDYPEILKKGFLLEWNASHCSECEGSGGRCGFQKNDIICFCNDGPHPKSCNHKRPTHIGRNIAIDQLVSDVPIAVQLSQLSSFLIVGVALGGSFILTCIIFFIHHRSKKHQTSTSEKSISRNFSSNSNLKTDLERGGSKYFQTPIFSYSELEEATDNFDTKKEVGDGGFGTVYHGKLRDGRVVAVKRLYENNCKRVEQFMNEITILSRLRHQNLVTLYGCTSRHSRELLLVYEFIPNGTVADHLYGEHAKPGMLTWPARLGIAVECADALSYLHASDTIHRDVKSNNILLDNNFHVKVADFGLSRLFPNDVTHVSTAPQGTAGYVDPEYYQCYQLTDKSDVYSFGVVLCELISSKPAVDINRHRYEISLANMAINKVQNHLIHELVDPHMGYDSDYSVRKMVTLMAELAFRCLQQDKDMRPSMVKVLEVLKFIENQDYSTEKADEIEIPSEEFRLLKNIPPLSPDSVSDSWFSNSTTQNASADVSLSVPKAVHSV